MYAQNLFVNVMLRNINCICHVEIRISRYVQLSRNIGETSLYYELGEQHTPKSTRICQPSPTLTPHKFDASTEL